MTTVVLDVWDTPAKVMAKTLNLEKVGDKAAISVKAVVVLMKFGRVQVTLEVDGKQEPQKK